MPSSVRAVVLIRTKPGTREQQRAAFAALAPVVRAEEGCLAYDLHEVLGEPDRFVLLEHWESQEALDAHDASAHMTEAGAATRPSAPGRSRSCCCPLRRSPEDGLR